MPTYVLALELEAAPRRLGTGAQIVGRMAATGGGRAFDRVRLEGKYAPMNRRLKALPNGMIKLGD
jgi:hypothetical protein